MTRESELEYQLNAHLVKHCGIKCTNISVDDNFVWIELLNEEELNMMKDWLGRAYCSINRRGDELSIRLRRDIVEILLNTEYPARRKNKCAKYT